MIMQTILSVFGAPAAILLLHLLCFFLYGQWQKEKGRAIGVDFGWQEGYLFQQNENKRHRDAKGRYKVV